ncbi:DUF1223 domain-containing protein [Terasakiella sp. SH-1]|uniref:DUF1223 domain-containing protein n=1 Tax=Terasakiella sp. SH-1 TaxID=2560057 RepID=UPI00142F8CCE|nr:DUF1223 domain-containing protein [Terasakiella sp. SH-1]
MRIVLILFALLWSFHVQANSRVHVVELFTSQGCSSCPPADAFLGELALRPDVLALAYHVDYWDYIGWKDIYAKSEFSDRQRQYARQFELRYVYTPQMIVDGTYQDSGNRRRNIVRAIGQGNTPGVDVSLVVRDGSLHIKSNHNDHAEVFYVRYLKETETKVRRGENRGKTLTDYHIVTDLVPIGKWSGGPAQFDLTNRRLKENQGHAIFLQRTSDMKIIAVLKL